MPASKPVKTVVHLQDHDGPAGLVEYDPPTTLADILARQHIPPFAEYLRTLVAPFNLLSYLHQFGHHMVSYLAAGHSHRQLYGFLTKGQTQAIPVSYSQFSRVLAVFRQQKGLPATQVRRSRLSPAAADRPPASTNAFNAAAAPPPVPLPEQPVKAWPAPVPLPAPEKPSTSKPPSPQPATADDATLSAEELELRELEARLAKRFRPFTLEDAKHGKPIEEAIAEKQRLDLEVYERGLKDGTITD